MTHASRALQSHDLSREGINSGHIIYFFTTQGHGEPPRVRDQLNAGATSGTTQIWKTIYTIRTHIHSNKANMKGWLWRPNDSRGPCGPKASWLFFLQVRKNPEKASPRYLIPTMDRTRDRCVTGAHATACSTAVHRKINNMGGSPGELSEEIVM